MMPAAQNLSILHFSTADREGGSARTAWRIHRGLEARGHRSRMLVRWRSSADKNVDVVCPGVWSLADRVAEAATSRLGLQYLAVPSSIRLPFHPWVAAADVIQLFNTHGAYLAQTVLPRLGRQAPVVWRLSDAWPVTGHCAYPGECTRWKTGCGSCPDLYSYPPIGLDTTAMLWKMKRRLYEALPNLAIVVPSSWTESVARQSPLFAGREIVRIPNGLATDRFRGFVRAQARQAVGIDQGETVMLFSAHIAFENPRKGTDILERALNRLPVDTPLTLCVLGRGAENWKSRVPVKVRAFEFTDDREAIANINAAADFAVVPSPVDNLPNTLLEAMAVGTPAIAFDVGGMRDAVLDGKTGILIAEPDDERLAAAILTLTTDASLRLTLSEAARTLIREEFSETQEVSRLEALYHRVVEAARR